jgi:putative spermidine/putrescine transport system substrate-binding protein
MKKMLILTALVLLLLALVPVLVSAQEGVECAEEVTVQKDDWLSKYGDKYFGNPLSWPAIMVWNNQAAEAEPDKYDLIDNPDLIVVGWSICIPSAEDAEAFLATYDPSKPELLYPGREVPVEAAGELVVVSWGGSYQDAQREAFFAPFEEETGIKIIEDTSPEHGKVKAQVDSGAPEWDVVTTGYTIFLELGPDYLEPIDYETYAEWYDGVIDAAKKEYGVMTISYCYALGYRTDAFPEGEEPQSWADFWDTEKFPGPRALGADSGVPWNSYEAALFAAGVPADEIYDQPIDAAIESWDVVKDDVIKWWGSGAEGVQLLADGEVVMALVPTSRIWELAEEGAPVAVQWNEALCGADYWWILNGTDNLEAAQKFVAFVSRDDRQAALVGQLPYGPANVKAFDALDESKAEWLPTAPDHVDKVFFTSSEWWGENREEVLEKFTTWKME